MKSSAPSFATNPRVAANSVGIGQAIQQNRDAFPQGFWGIEQVKRLPAKIRA
jgi:hypothetical protein